MLQVIEETLHLFFFFFLKADNIFKDLPAGLCYKYIF